MNTTVWLTLIVLHAIAGVAAFALGTAALMPPVRARHRWVPAAFVGSTGALLVVLIAAVVVHWSELDTTSRFAYCGLGLLGASMAFRARRAATTVRSGAVRQRRFVDDVGFVLIALFDGLVIVTAIDLGAPGWLVVILAVAPVVLGHRLLATAPEQAGPETAEHADRIAYGGEDRTALRAMEPTVTMGPRRATGKVSADEVTGARGPRTR